MSTQQTNANVRVTFIGGGNMGRVEFLLNLGRYNVFPLAAELDDLEHDQVH